MPHAANVPGVVVTTHTSFELRNSETSKSVREIIFIEVKWDVDVCCRFSPQIFSVYALYLLVRVDCVRGRRLRENIYIYIYISLKRWN